MVHTYLCVAFDTASTSFELRDMCPLPLLRQVRCLNMHCMDLWWWIICLCVGMSFRLPACLLVCGFGSVCLSVYLSVCLSVCLSNFHIFLYINANTYETKVKANEQQVSQLQLQLHE